MIACRLITREQLHTFLNEAYNPPTVAGEADKRAFHDEYWANHSRINEALSGLGRRDAFGEGDYSMNEDWYLSRGVSVQITSEAMIRPELVSTVQNVLKQLPEKYSVYVDHGLLDIDLFFLLIEPDRVAACCEDPRLLERLGLSEQEL